MRESEVRLACHHGFLVEVGRLEMGVCPTPGGEGRLPCTRRWRCPSWPVGVAWRRPRRRWSRESWRDGPGGRVPTEDLICRSHRGTGALQTHLG